MALEVFRLMGTVAINKDQALKDMKVVQDQAQRASKEMGRSFAKFTADHSAQFKKVGMVAAAAGAVISLAIRKVGKSFDEYESALVDMGKITDESFESIENRMKELPPVLGSLTDLTRGYYQIVSAGVKEPVEAINTLTVSAQTAAAAHMNQSEVVKGLTKVMAGYEGRIETVSEAADLMFAIEKEGQTTVGELIPIIGSLATMSAQLKISQDEMGASMAVITKTAGSTAEASTELEGVLTGLMKPTEAMTAAINKMGFETAEAAIEELGFVEVLRRLDEATGGSSEKLGELFGRKQAILGVSKLTSEGMKILKDTIASVAEKAGMADDAYRDWLTTGEALNKQTKAVTENLLILIGKALDPMMDKLQIRLTSIIERMGEWVGLNPELAATIAQITAGLGMFMIPFGALMIMLPGLMIALPKIIGFIGFLSNAFAIWAASLGVTMPILAGFLVSIGLIVKATYGWIEAIKESKRIKEAEVVATEAQVAATEKLREAYNLTDAEMQYWIENHKLSASVLQRVEEHSRELAKIQYQLISTGRDLSGVVAETAKTFEELDAAILSSIIAGKELSEEQEAYMSLRQRMSDVDRTATQMKIDDLDRECVALLANMNTNLMTMEQIDQYRQVMLQHIIAESSEREDHLRNMEEIESKMFELTHTQTEIRIKDLEKKKEAYIKTTEEAMLSAEKEEEAVAKIVAAFEKEKASIYELAIVRSEKEIESLNKAIERRKEAEEAIDDLIKKRDEEINNLKKLEEGYKDVAEAAAKVPPKPVLVGAAEPGQFKVLDPEGEYVGVTSDPNALTPSEIEAGWQLVPLPVMSKGGLIQTFMNMTKHLAGGGAAGTDIVPIMATPGEYLIKKGMVDFIKRTGMVTGGLVKAIEEGLPTPNPPGFAVGGVIGPRLGGSLGVRGASLIFEPSSIVINCKYLDWKTVNQAGDMIFDVVKRRAGNMGWVFGRS